MQILAIREFAVAPREAITLVFQRSRPNLPVLMSIDDGPFVPVLNQFVAKMPADPTKKRKMVVMTVGEDRDTCRITIMGDSGPPDVDSLLVAGVVPIASARYRFKVSI